MSNKAITIVQIVLIVGAVAMVVLAMRNYQQPEASAATARMAESVVTPAITALPLKEGDIVQLQCPGGMNGDWQTGQVTVSCPTITPTWTATDTATDTPTNTPTPTPTFTATATSTDTPISTPTDTATSTPTSTNTATDTPTATAKSSPTSTPTTTFTDTPTSTPTNTAVPTVTATITTPPSMNLGFMVSTTNVAFWNGAMLAQDQSIANTSNAPSLSQQNIGHKAVFTQQLSGIPQAISLAQSNGAQTVIFNDESTSNATTLLANEASAEAQVHAAGLLFMEAPTGSSLETNVLTAPALVSSADSTLYQSQYIQQSDPNYANRVATTVANIRHAAPGHPVWVQVSINPPANTTETADQIENDAMNVWLAANPDGIFFWYGSTNLSKLETVITFFRA